MSPDQLADRATLLRVLTDAGWEPRRSDDASKFDAGRYLTSEVEVEYERHSVSFKAAERRVVIRLEPNPKVSRVGLVELAVHGAVGLVAELVVAHQARLSTEPVQFVTALVGMPESRVQVLKGQDWHVLTPDTVRMRFEPRFVAVEHADCNFYLGQVIDSSFFLAHSDLPAAHARCLEAIAAWTDEMTASTTLEELFAASFVGVSTDTDGNVVGLDQGGDAWVLDHLDKIADLVRPGSYFLIQDDESSFWRVEYTAAGALYYREPRP
jgi:hypothetical protein